MIPAIGAGQNISLGAARQFGILVLPSGSMIINSSTKIVGDVGYSEQSVSISNQKAEDFTGTARVHSSATFACTDKNFLPSGGIIRGGASNTLLAQANHDVITAAAALNTLVPTHTFGAVTSSLTVDSAGSVNVVSIGSVDLNGATLQLRGRPSANDFFVVRVTGNFNFSQSYINLLNTDASRVIFYFPNMSQIKINKSASVFHGTLLAPIGSVEYHNPAYFAGAIIARSINLHSMFNLWRMPLQESGIPLEQATFVRPPTGKLNISRNVTLKGTAVPVGFEITRWY